MRSALVFVGAALRVRHSALWAAAIALLAALLCAFVPQFDILNYYFSLAMALPVALSAALLSARLAFVHRDAPLPRLVLAASAAATALLLVPLAVVTVGALWATNCNPWGGLLHYAMGPGCGVWVAASFGLLAGSWVHRRWHATALVLGALLFELAWGFARFYREPPIFAYDWLVGFFSGAVYDDVIELSVTTLWYRAATLVLVALLLSGTALARSRSRLALSLTLLLATGLSVFISRFAVLGITPTAETIARALGGHIETEHFVIHYSRTHYGEADAPAVRHLVADHEYRYTQLCRALDLPNGLPWRITSYVYGTSGEKRRLMGADQTYIAKPWRHEVHLHALELGAPVLKHELAHVFGAALNDGWLGLPTDLGLLPKMALVEGFAVAVTGPEGRLGVHQWTAAMRQLGLAPSLERLLGRTGFLATHAGKAYTITGSFLQHLAETRGASVLRAVYATGDLEAATGQTLASLEVEWGARLDDRSQTPLTDADLALAQLHFDAPSLFDSVCALETAGWERDAAAARSKGDRDRALALREHVLSFDPRSPRKRQARVEALIDAGRVRWPEALAAAEALADDTRIGKVARARARARQADVLWLLDRRDEARVLYDRDIVPAPLDGSLIRTAVVRAKALAFADATLGDAVRDYLEAPGSDDRAAAERLETHAARSSEPEARAIFTYLAARRWMGARDWTRARRGFTAALEALDHGMLVHEAHVQLGLAAFHDGDLDASATAFDRAASTATGAGTRELDADWAARARWMQSRSASVDKAR